MSNRNRRSHGSPRFVRLVAATLSLSLAVPVSAAPPDDSFQEDIDVNLVNVDVVVVDKSGKLVTDLSREDFQITDDGKKVKVDYFAPMGGGDAAPPETAGVTPTSLGRVGAAERNFIVFVDLDSSIPTSRNRVLDEVAAYLASTTEPMNTMVVTYGRKGLDIAQPFTKSSAEWKAAIEAAKNTPSQGMIRQSEQRRLVESIKEIQYHADNPRALQGARDQLDTLVGSIRVEAEAMQLDGRNTLRAIQTLVSVLSTVQGRKSLLYVGDGVPIHPGEELFNLLADVFESDRRFQQSGGLAPVGANPGSTSPPDAPGGGDPPTGGGGGPTDLPSTVGPMAESTQNLRFDTLGYDLTNDIRALTATANSHRVTIYGLSADSPGGAMRADTNLGGRVPAGATVSYDVSRSQIREQSLQLMAGETGGLSLAPNAGVGGFLDRVMADEDNSYSLAYLSPHDGDSKFHRIKVKVNRKGVELRHREGYIDRPRDVRIGDVVAGALLLGSGENPHGIEMEIGSQQPAENDETAVTLVLHIPIDSLELAAAGDRHEAKLDLYLLTRDETGMFAPMRSVSFAVTLSAEQLAQAKGKFYGATLPVPLKKGPHTIAVGIVEPATQRTSVVRTELEVGAAAAPSG